MDTSEPDPESSLGATVIGPAVVSFRALGIALRALIKIGMRMLHSPRRGVLVAGIVLFPLLLLAAVMVAAVGTVLIAIALTPYAVAVVLCGVLLTPFALVGAPLFWRTWKANGIV